MTAMDEFQNQEVNIVLEQIYKMIDENAEKGLFNLYVNLIGDDFVFQFNEQIQTLLKENGDFCQLIKQKLQRDGYKVELFDLSVHQIKRLGIYWNKQIIEQPKEKKKKWFWQKG